MISRCRCCMKDMPKDRDGYNQVCSSCKELYEKTFSYKSEQARKCLDELGKALRQELPNILKFGFMIWIIIVLIELIRGI